MIILDTTDGTELQVVTNAHKREATALAFSPNSQLLATGCHGGVIRTWANKKETEIRSGRRIDMGEEMLSRRAKIMTLFVE
jgi:WD40 repeat protein